MNKVRLHRLCDYCATQKKVRLGYINIFDLNDEKLKRACEYHFRKHKKDCKHQGYINFGGFGFFIDSDHNKLWNIVNEDNRHFIEIHRRLQH